MGVRTTLWTSRSAARSASVSWPALSQDRSWRRDRATARPSSGMLRGYRRFFAIVAFLLLEPPLVAGLVYPDGAASILMEGRTPTPAPRAPVDIADWFALPKQIDAYLQDHIGLRQALLRAHRELSKPPFGSYKVLMGRGGRMFYLGNEMVIQSAGLVMRDQAVAQTTDLLARMNEELRARGIRFFVAPPPSSSKAISGSSTTSSADSLPAFLSKSTPIPTRPSTLISPPSVILMATVRSTSPATPSTRSATPPSSTPISSPRVPSRSISVSSPTSRAPRPPAQRTSAASPT